MLNLRGNSLRDLPAQFSKLSDLLVLDLSHNQFREFPLPLCDTVSLKYIDISDCHISAIPNEIGKLRNVQVYIIRTVQYVKVFCSRIDIKSWLYTCQRENVILIVWEVRHRITNLTIRLSKSGTIVLSK